MTDAYLLISKCILKLDRLWIYLKTNSMLLLSLASLESVWPMTSYPDMILHKSSKKQVQVNRFFYKSISMVNVGSHNNLIFLLKLSDLFGNFYVWRPSSICIVNAHIHGCFFHAIRSTPISCNLLLTVSRRCFCCGYTNCPCLSAFCRLRFCLGWHG